MAWNIDPSTKPTPLYHVPGERVVNEIPVPLPVPNTIRIVLSATLGMRSRGEPVKNGQLTNYVTWTAVLCSVTIDQMKLGNKLRDKLSWTLSRHYSINANILKHPSFSWEHDKNRLKVANESAWIEYCESHPDARPYRKMVIENWEDICTIFAQDEAIGDNAQTPTEVDVDMIHKDSNDAEESKETAGSNDAVSDYNYVSECTKSPSRVKGGCREAAVRALEEEVDAVVTKTNVQSRLKTWYKYYSVIGDILRWPRISWDYQRHRLKSHPDSKPYRKITIENWQDICTLFAPDSDTG
ncbi:hypothetical protein RJ641_013190 [Dillenia turbinata]|uniref:Myb/SANT-like domain-containing protein n=1 Tax=Dillenia turbinata TaxID=194707 RepID=A0AAN8ZPT0_9MAGN